VGEAVVEVPAVPPRSPGADVLRLQQRHADARAGQLARGAQPGEAAPDDRHVEAALDRAGFGAAEGFSARVPIAGHLHTGAVNAGAKLGHGAAQNWATLGLRGTRVMGGGQSAALSM